ncbi:MAG: MarR family transcriptional regulator [Anaerolineae bacterium]|nr:MarR family transcriptional regulator [Anaerolineae bacterium]
MTSDYECAGRILDTFPQAMRFMAHDLRDTSGRPGTVPQYRILSYLYHHGPDSMGGLAECQNVTLPTMTKTVAGLVERGLLERETDANDRRVVMLRLTPDGEAMFQDIRDRMQARLTTIIATMTADEQEALATGLRAFLGALQRAHAEEKATGHGHCAAREG